MANQTSFTGGLLPIKVRIPISLCAIVSLAVFMLLPTDLNAQSLIIQNNDSSIVKEYRNGDEWGCRAKDGFVVSLGNKYVSDDYGNFYQLTVLIQNLTSEPYTFDPDSIKAYVVNRDSLLENMKIYSAEAFQKKIKNDQMWTQVFAGIAAGINTAQASYQTSYVSTTGYGGYTYIQPVTTYNASAASLANMIASNQMMDMAKQMEADRKVRDEGYLKKNTIHSGEGVIGYMNVKRIKGSRMTVIIPVNGEQYIFVWDIAKKKKKS